MTSQTNPEAAALGVLADRCEAANRHPNMSMRDKCILALAKAAFPYSFYGCMASDAQDRAKEHALLDAAQGFDAVIEALSEPSDEMVEAGSQFILAEKGAPDWENTVEALQAMLKAAAA